MDKITINNCRDKEDCLVLSMQEYEGLKERIVAGLLSYYDRVEFGLYREAVNNELLIRGYLGEWVAINPFPVAAWYGYTTEQFDEAMQERIELLKAQNYYGRKR